MLKRRNDWQIKLSEYLHKVKDKKFKWGTHDCVMHSVNAVRAITGKDLAKGYRQSYKTKAKAYAIVARDFDKDTDNMFIKYLGEFKTNIKKAKRGDVVRITFEGDKAYGIIDDTGRFIAMVTPKDGLIRVPLNSGEVYWGVN